MPVPPNPNPNPNPIAHPLVHARPACVSPARAQFPEVYDKVKSEAGISDLSAEIAAEAAAAAEAAIGRSATKRGTGSRRARSPAK